MNGAIDQPAALTTSAAVAAVAGSSASATPFGPRPARWPLRCPAGVSSEALALLAAVEVVDLHLDSFITTRLVGYDLHKRHGLGPLRGHFFGQLDWPRAVEGGLTGAMWSITTNPLRGAKARWAAFERNLERLQRDVARTDGALRIANNYADYLRARADGAHVVLPSIQGANALQAAPAGPASIAGDLIVRATLVHLTNAVYGPTSSPLGLGSRDDGLSSAGFELVEQLDQQRIFVDLAHIGHRAFFDACAAHDPQLPLLATHTGCAGVRPHWRNLNDDQLRAIAATDGVVGIIFQAAFLRRAGGPRDVDMVVEHLTHVRDTIGARAVGVGSDYDGAIVTSADLRDGATGYLRLTDALLRAGWRHDDIIAALGGNFLRALKVMRPGS